jgi:beta-phosphoglucomutase-like phosphatase (HAD superfamily)
VSENFRPEAVFWDVDGTLILTEGLHYEVIRDWCAGFGYELTPEANEELLGKTMPEKWGILRARLPESATEEAFREDCARAYLAGLRADMMRPEPVQAVRRLHGLGVLQAAVSNGEAEVIEANLRALGIWEMMSFIVCGNDVAQGKPAPDPYLEAARRAGLDPAGCMAVEDSPVGVASASGAGMFVLAWPEEQVGLPDASLVLGEDGEFPWGMFGE